MSVSCRHSRSSLGQVRLIETSCSPGAISQSNAIASQVGCCERGAAGCVGGHTWPCQAKSVGDTPCQEGQPVSCDCVSATGHSVLHQQVWVLQPHAPAACGKALTRHAKFCQQAYPLSVLYHAKNLQLSYAVCTYFVQTHTM